MLYIKIDVFHKIIIWIEFIVVQIYIQPLGFDMIIRYETNYILLSEIFLDP